MPVGAIVATISLARPFSSDLLRYAGWRIGVGRALVAGTVASGGARIAWRTIGPLDDDIAIGPALVLLHGGFGTDLDWYAQVPTLARRHALVLIDTRGHGRSSMGHRPLSYRLFADDVVAVLDALGRRCVDVVGWSDGGNTALVLGRRHPARVHRLVAISANVHPDGLVSRVREALARGDVSSSFVARLLRSLVSPEPGRRDELERGVNALWRARAALGSGDAAAIAAPVLLVAGSDDDVRRDHLDELVRALPDARLEVLPGVGHTVPQSAPRRVLELVEDFLTHGHRPR